MRDAERRQRIVNWMDTIYDQVQGIVIDNYIFLGSPEVDQEEQRSLKRIEHLQRLDGDMLRCFRSICDQAAT